MAKSKKIKDKPIKKFEVISSNLKSTPTIIAHDLKIEGNITGSGVVEIEGHVKGNVHCNIIALREGGFVEGSIVAESLSIMGRFEGTIKTKNINISSKAQVSGEIEYDSLAVEDGAYIDGQFKRSSTKETSDKS